MLERRCHDPSSIVSLVTSAMCAVVGLHHLLLALPVEERKPYLLVAVAALGVAARGADMGFFARGSERDGKMAL
jgi:hypothetical protein